MTIASKIIAKYPLFSEGDALPRLGLLPLDAEEWIEISSDYAEQMALKRELLSTNHDAVFRISPAAEEPARELLEELIAHLLNRYSHFFHRNENHLTNIITGESWNLSDLKIHPLDLCGRLVQDDICVMVSRNTEYTLEGASVCFPANWALSEKFGRSLVEIHDPVPGYAGRFERAVNKFFQNIQPGKWIWRVNWFVHDDPTLFLPRWKEMGAGITPENAGDCLWLRTERQTFHRLTQTGAVVLTFHTYVEKLGDVVRTPQLASQFLELLRNMSYETQNYRHMGTILPSLLTWLERVR